MFGSAKRLAANYRREGGYYLIELRLSEARRLFNSFDPAPFLEKDLDNEAESYIVDTVKEFPLEAPLKLLIHLPESEHGSRESESIPEAVRHYFDYRAHHAAMNLRFLMQQGRASLAIGLLFLFGCIVARQALAGGNGVVGEIVGEGLLICGWVAMWRPIQIYLYDWWPIQRMRRIYEKIHAMPIELRKIGS